MNTARAAGMSTRVSVYKPQAVKHKALQGIFQQERWKMALGTLEKRRK
jgi:hypothetical protein